MPDAVLLALSEPRLIWRRLWQTYSKVASSRRKRALSAGVP
jgi:hypothetical protein